MASLFLHFQQSNQEGYNNPIMLKRTIKVCCNFTYTVTSKCAHNTSTNMRQYENTAYQSGLVWLLKLKQVVQPDRINYLTGFRPHFFKNVWVTRQSQGNSLGSFCCTLQQPSISIYVENRRKYFQLVVVSFLQCWLIFLDQFVQALMFLDISK